MELKAWENILREAARQAEHDRRVRKVASCLAAIAIAAVVIALAVFFGHVIAGEIEAMVLDQFARQMESNR